MADDHEGPSGNLGDPPVPTEQAGRRYRLTNSGMIRGPATGADGDERRSQRWYRHAKATERGERGGRESQRLRVPLTQGNQPEGPW